MLCRLHDTHLQSPGTLPEDGVYGAMERKTLPDASREYFANRFTWYSGELKLYKEAVDKSAGNGGGSAGRSDYQTI